MVEVEVVVVVVHVHFNNLFTFVFKLKLLIIVLLFKSFSRTKINLATCQLFIYFLLSFFSPFQTHFDASDQPSDGYHFPALM